MIFDKFMYLGTEWNASNKEELDHKQVCVSFSPSTLFGLSCAIPGKARLRNRHQSHAWVFVLCANQVQGLVVARAGGWMRASLCTRSSSLTTLLAWRFAAHFA